MRRSACVGLMIAAFPVSTLAQQAWVGATLETYSFGSPAAIGIDQAQLTTIPFGVSWSTLPVQVRLDGAWADGIVTMAAGDDSELSGLTDTRVRATYSYGPVQVGAFASLPSGRSNYGADEVALLGILSSELLPFSIESWGTGGGVGGEGDVTIPFGSTDLTLGASFAFPRTHAPFSILDESYRPGHQMLLRGSSLTRIGAASLLYVAASYRRSGPDIWSGEDVFRSGPRWDATAALATPIGARESLSLSGGFSLRAAGSGTSRVVGFSGATEWPSRRSIDVALEVQATRGRWMLIPELGIRMLSTGDGVGRGWVVSAGGGADYRLVGRTLSRRLLLSPHAVVRTGSAEGRVSGASGFLGWEAGTVLRWEGVP